MTFFDNLNNLISHIDSIENEKIVEARLKDKLASVFNFIFIDQTIDPICTFYVRLSNNSCLIELKNNAFWIIATYSVGAKEFSFTIRLNLQKTSVPPVYCYFDENLNLLRYEHTGNFGEFGFNRSLFMKTVRYADGTRNRNMYLKKNPVHKLSPVSVISNLDESIHQVDREFDRLLSKVLLFNFWQHDLFKAAFEYLPEIDFDDDKIMTTFINDLCLRYKNNDLLLNNSLELMVMHNI